MALQNNLIFHSLTSCFALYITILFVLNFLHNYTTWLFKSIYFIFIEFKVLPITIIKTLVKCIKITEIGELCRYRLKST